MKDSEEGILYHFTNVFGDTRPFYITCLLLLDFILLTDSMGKAVLLLIKEPHDPSHLLVFPASRPGSPCSRGFLHRVSVSLALSDLMVLILALQTSGMCACRAIVLVWMLLSLN